METPHSLIDSPNFSWTLYLLLQLAMFIIMHDSKTRQHLRCCNQMLLASLDCHKWCSITAQSVVNVSLSELELFGDRLLGMVGDFFATQAIHCLADGTPPSKIVKVEVWDDWRWETMVSTLTIQRRVKLSSSFCFCDSMVPVKRELMSLKRPPSQSKFIIPF